MFTLYHSNQLDLLRQLVLTLSKKKPLPNPFDKEVVLVQSPGMAQWLKLEIAKEVGIAANIDFILPATFIWQAFTRVLPDIPEQSVFNKETLIFKIMALLPKFLTRSEFSSLDQYLEGEIEPDRLYQLAEKIADIYDQYLVYRPEWILSWEADEKTEPDDLCEDELWQPVLWKALVEDTLIHAQNPCHRANLCQRFIESLTKETASFLPQRIFVFGISAMPPQYMDILKAMGEYRDVHFMLNNPCRQYWGDIHERDNPGNSLLASMGKLGRDNLYLLTQLEPNEIDAYVDLRKDSLLHHIQSDILELESRGPELFSRDGVLFQTETDQDTVGKEDLSLSFHSCHSPMREVEVLHDHLLKMLDDDPDLLPRDILVMVADIDAYAPAVRAVFGNATGKNHIPFAISDQMASSDNPVLQAFFQILSLPRSRASTEDILSLLEVPSVMRRFSLESQEFVLLKRWVTGAGARWGLDEKTATFFDLNEQKQNTWLFALERMLLGYAMPESAGFFSGCLPYDEVQGLEAQIAGKLSIFIHSLIKTRKVLSLSCSAKKWQEIINKILDDFFIAEPENDPLILRIRRQLQALNDATDQARYENDLHLDEIRHYLNLHIAQDKSSQRFLSGPLNICTLMPMRSIPFKTICLLGMNDGVYPRNTSQVGFDLMKNRARAGDRSRRDDDRYLFLEAMLAAEERLYISYVGRSVVDNSPKVASVLVSELLEYTLSGFHLEGDEGLSAQEKEDRLHHFLVKQHALTPYSSQTFKDGSYVNQWLAVAQGKRKEISAFGQLTRRQDIINETLELSRLKYFMRLPVRGFFQMRLSVDLQRDNKELDESEAFSLDKLDQYGIKIQLLNMLKDGENIDEASGKLTTRLSAQGLLPIGACARLTLQECHKDVEKIYNLIEPFIVRPLEDIEVDITLLIKGLSRELQLQGWLKNVYSAANLTLVSGRHQQEVHLVRERMGKRRTVDMIHAWLDHLCLCAMDLSESSQTYLVSTDKLTTFLTVEKTLALEILARWAEFMLKGLERPLPFFPKIAGDILTLHYDAKKDSWNEELLWEPEGLRDIDDDLKKLTVAFNGGYMSVGEREDPYIRRLWSDLTPEIIKEMDSDVMKYLYPMLSYIEEKKQ